MGAIALAGAFAGLGLSYRAPPRYVSSALLRVTSVVESGKTAAPDVLQREAQDRVVALWVDLAGRNSLLNLLKAPGLDLYPEERERQPLEDVAEQVMRDDLHVVPATLASGGVGFRISFAYQDRAKAQAVVQELAAQAVRSGAELDRTKSTQWTAAYSEPIPFSQRIDVAEPADLPSGLSQPRRWIFMVAGLAAGLLVGALLFLTRRRPKFVLRVVACGVAGGALAGGLALLISEDYTVRGVLRLTAPFDPVHVSGAVAAPSAEYWMDKLRGEILDPFHIRAILSNQKFASTGLRADDIVKNRERVFAMQMLPAGSEESPGPAFEIVCTLPDKDVARGLVAEMVSESEVRYVAAVADRDRQGDPEIRFAHEHHLGEELTVVVQPVTPEEPSTHYRLQLTLAGAAIGMLAAIARWSASSQPAAAPK